jgi:aryl-alcohol dehydrogenase-like predicted oxidoreductase
MMEYQMLGKSLLNISRIGFGTMSLELNNPLTETLLQRALDGGINYFDTADMYQQGLNETFLGRAFQGKRKNIILATKVGNQWRADGSGWDWNPSKKYILSAIDQSLQRLQTDYIDLYQLHGGTLEDPIDEIIEAFEYLKTAGKILNYGISSIRPNVIREYVKRSSIISVMMQYSLLDRRPEESMLSFLSENKIGVLVRGSIAKGLLVSKPAENYLNYSADQVREMANTVKSISDKSHSPFETAVHFVLQQPAICTTVIGIRTMEQLQDALAAGGSSKLNSGQMKVLENVLPANKYMDHR